MAEEIKKTSGRPKKVETPTPVVENSNDGVMELLKQMQAELDLLKKENKILKQSGTTNSTIDETITSDTEIEVMSLFSGTLNLYTEGFGNGSVYKFDDGFGSTIDIPFGDLKLIVKNNNKIAKDGYFYILNEEAVELVRLKKAYSALLEAEKLETIDKLSDDKIITLYNSAPKSQQELIITYFASKKENGQPINRNLLYQLGELCGKKLIEE